MIDDPTRVRDDPTADAHLRTDLTRAAEHPSLDFDVAGELARLQAAMGPGGTGSTGGGEAAAGVTGGTSIGSGSSLVGIGLTAVVTVGLVAAGLAWFGSTANRPASDGARPAKAQRVAAPRSEPVPPEATGTVDRTSEPAGATGAALEGQREPDPAIGARRHPPQGQGPRGEASPGQVDPRMELEHMAQLRRILERDPAAALAMARAGQRKFRPGLFVEEREASAVLALDRLGRHDEARESAKRFLRRYPQSAFAERIGQIVRSH